MIKVCTVHTELQLIQPSFGGGFRRLIKGSSSRSDNSFHISNAWDAIEKFSFLIRVFAGGSTHGPRVDEPLMVDCPT